MAAGDRFKAWFESVGKSWQDALNTFLVSVVSLGFDAFFKVLGKSLSPKLKPLIDSLEATGEVPAQLQPLIDELKNPTGEAAALLGQSVAGTAMSGVIERVLAPFLNPLAYAVNRVNRTVVSDMTSLMILWQRKVISDEVLDHDMAFLGFTSLTVDRLKLLYKNLFGTATLIDLWKRDRAKESELKDRFRKLGYDDSQWEEAKKLAIVLPSASDIIRFAVREVYTPEVAEKFGQYADFPDKAMVDADTIGFSKDLLTKYWAAHWELPSAGQGFEMLHRGVLSYSELEMLLKALDVMPFFRDKLIRIAYSTYTRVDARRMWDMGVLDDAALKQAYTEEGYDEPHANNMVLWTKVYMTYPDLIARYKNGYINLDDVKSELTRLGVSERTATYLIEQKIKKLAPERTAKERDLTKAEIIKGLYKDVIDEPTAIGLLTDLGYDEAEARFIIVINMPKEETKKAKSAKELTKSDVLSGLKNEIMTAEEAISKLVNIRYTTDDATYLVDLAIKTKKPVAEAKEKELTKADIVKGVKVGLITAEEGYIMLQDIGYSPDNAAFILMIATAVTGGSPDSYSDFKSATQAYRASQGLPAKVVPVDLQVAERALIAAKAAFDYGKAHKIEETRLDKLQQAVTDATLAYKQQLAKYQMTK